MKTIIVNLGAFLKLNNKASIEAFNGLARNNKNMGKTIPWGSIMLKILDYDEEFKAGLIDTEKFREVIQGLLAIDVTNDEFDNAWNAMLGDKAGLEKNLVDFRKKLAEKNLEVILASNTNPIHMIKLLLDFTQLSTGKIKLFEMPLYVSYLQKLSHQALYAKIVDEQKLEPTETALVVHTNHGFISPIKERDEKVEKDTRAWAETTGIHIIDHDSSKKNLMEAIEAGLENQEPTRTNRKALA
jgi:hypothetical protein